MRVVPTKLARFPLALALLAGCSPEPAPAPTTPAPPEQAQELMRGLPEDRVLRDLAAAFAYLKTSPEVKPDRIGSIGWCMGGGYSIKFGGARPTLAACAG